MIKEALQYIIGLQQPRVEEIKGKHYYFYNGTPMLLGENRTCDALEVCFPHEKRAERRFLRIV